MYLPLSRSMPRIPVSIPICTISTLQTFQDSVVCICIISINFLSVQVRDEYRTDYDEGRGGYGKSAIRMFEKLGHPEYSGARNSM